MKLRVFIGVVGFLFVSGSVSHASNLVKCEAIKRGENTAGGAERGLRIAFFYFDDHHKPVMEGAQRTLWFGRNQVLRDQGLQACKEQVATFDCRQDGPTHISYGRGGVSVKITDWALHEADRGVRETFHNPPIVFMASASEQCYAELIDQVAQRLERQFSL